MTGVEGYVESAASGLLAGLNAARMANGQECVVFPKETMIGAMSHYITKHGQQTFPTDERQLWHHRTVGWQENP